MKPLCWHKIRFQSLTSFLGETTGELQYESVNLVACISKVIRLDELAYAIDRAIEVSVVMPCLNEADTLSVCIEKAQRALRQNDIAGEIVEAGEYVSGLKPGERVLLAPMHFCNICVKCVAGLQNQCSQFSVLGNAVDGGNCELIAVPAVNVIPIPDGLDFNEAASVPLVFTTAWHMLTGRAAIRPGQTVLVLGANSGVGIAAIQIAKLFHARVIATAGDERKMERARELGADFVINHYEQKISQEVRKITSSEGVDIVIEHVGPATWEESVRSLKIGGTLVTCGATTGPKVELDLRFLFSRQLALLGSYMGTMNELHEVLGHVFAGRLKSVIDHTFPLSEIRAAHEYMEKSQMFGKIVLNP